MNINLTVTQIVRIVSCLEIKKEMYRGTWKKETYEEYVKLEKLLKDALRKRLKL